LKAGVLRAVHALRFAEVDIPALAPGDMLLRVKTATICGTDIRILRGKKTSGIRYPSVLGHEFSAIVVDNGGHRQFACNEPVIVCPQFSCGKCASCSRGAENLCLNLEALGYGIDGAFAEYIRIPERAVISGCVFKLSDDVGFDLGALVEPLACVINGQELVGVFSGDNVLIFGAGPIGILHIILARHTGAHKILVSEPNALRRRAALHAGADIVVDPVHEDLNMLVRYLTNDIGVDVAICAIGVPSLVNDAIHSVRRGGRISLFAGYSDDGNAAVNINALHYHEILTVGSSGLTRANFEQALSLIKNKKSAFEDIITHRLPLTKIVEAFDIAENGQAIKVGIVDT
jgi:L-iditol 2-dehydrogenase